MSVVESRMHARRMKYIEPMVRKAWLDTYVDLDDSQTRRLQAILRAIDSCSETNCWWAIYRAAQHWRPIVAKMIRDRK